MKQQKPQTDKSIKKIFNLSTIMSQIMSYMAYIIAVASAMVLVYISFIDHLAIEVDWAVLTIYSLLAVTLSWINWTAFYKQTYERTMTDDINENELNRYSIHSRYYHAIKDWDDGELQAKIDAYNKEYTAKWLRWVEHRTGYPIETTKQIELDDKGNSVIDETTGEPKIIVTPGIKDLPYKGFKFPILMWRIKNHRYPQSGYKTSMELMTLLSYQEANNDKRDLRADKRFYRAKAGTRLLTSLGLISITGSMIPEMISGNIWEAILKLVIALGTLLSSVISGAIAGIKGARLKLSVVEDTCMDLERWADKKPIVEKYQEPISTTPIVEDEPEKEKEPYEVATQIFNQPNLPNK